MRRSTGKIFIIGFLKSLLFLVFFTAIMVFTYKAVMHFYGVPERNIIEAISPISEKEPITQARIDDISKHLIFAVDEETGDIIKLVLEIFNCEEHRIYYITIPIKTQLALSDGLHKELVLIKPSIPQYLKLSAITGYLPKEKVCEYGVVMIEDLLDIEISYYTLVPQAVYQTIFETEQVKKDVSNKQDSGDRVPREVFSEEFLEYLSTIDTETKLSTYIKELYTQVDSNLSLADKLNYMESYIKTPGKNIVFELIAGEDSNSAYNIDIAKAKEMLKSYTQKEGQ